MAVGGPVQRSLELLEVVVVASMFCLIIKSTDFNLMKRGVTAKRR